MILKAIIYAVALVSVFTACNGSKSSEEALNEAAEIADASLETTTEAITETAQTPETETVQTSETETAAVQAETQQTTTEAEAEQQNSKYTIVIDPGHQRKGNNAQEPVGPGASQTKAKITGGTHSVSAGLSEYELNLQISFKLRDLLVARGYNVIMTRESHDVDISNSERAQIANNANADAFVRIHANGSENSAANGAMTICQTSSNPFNAQYYSDSYRLSETILNSLVAETGAKRERVWETDTMSGINWAKVPSTIVEVGYMTNPEEDRKLASDDYQNKVAEGIAKGIDNFFQ